MEQIIKFLPYVAMIAVFYFLMIRPQQKKAKTERNFEAALKINDKIITKSGIHGKISEISETTIVIETMSGKLKMERSSISMEMSSKLNTAVVKK
jgi:preprotein translocase subunit YajC